MTIIKATTKKGQSLINSANYTQGTDLGDIYGSYSEAKAHAMASCKALCFAENGSNFRIISHNCNFFSVAWDSPNGLRIETAYNSYLVR